MGGIVCELAEYAPHHVTLIWERVGDCLKFYAFCPEWLGAPVAPVSRYFVSRLIDKKIPEV